MIRSFLGNGLERIQPFSEGINKEKDYMNLQKRKDCQNSYRSNAKSDRVKVRR